MNIHHWQRFAKRGIRLALQMWRQFPSSAQMVVPRVHNVCIYCNYSRNSVLVLFVYLVLFWQTVKYYGFLSCFFYIWCFFAKWSTHTQTPTIVRAKTHITGLSLDLDVMLAIKQRNKKSRAIPVLMQQNSVGYFFKKSKEKQDRVRPCMWIDIAVAACHETESVRHDTQNWCR